MNRRAAALCALWLCACGGGAPSDAVPARSTRGAFRAQDSDPAPVAPPNPTSATPAAIPPSLPPIQAPAAPVAPPKDAKKEEEKPRDYSAELLAALGTPTDCLKPRSAADAPSEISISLEAHLVEIGMVTRAYAQSSQLDKEELACVQQRLGGVRFHAPVDGTPRSVAATLTLKQKKADPKVQAPSAAKPGY
jgi:hypothetical protein